MRRRRAELRKRVVDAKYKSGLLAHFMSMVMRDGKKSLAERIVYGCMDIVKETTSQDPMKVFQKAIDNVRPAVELKSRRVGGATYQVPVEVNQRRGNTVAIRWIRDFAKARKGKPMKERLASEILEAFKGEGSAIKKRQDTYKMAEANKAFAHYRW